MLALRHISPYKKPNLELKKYKYFRQIVGKKRECIVN